MGNLKNEIRICQKIHNKVAMTVYVWFDFFSFRRQSRNDFRTEIVCVLITQQNLQKFELVVEKFKFPQILLGNKNATSVCSKNISTLLTVCT